MSPDIPAHIQVVPQALAAACILSFVALIVLISLTTQMFKHRETQKTIRMAIEKGQALDPATLERLLQSDRPPPPSRFGFLFGGIFLLAIAGGMVLIGWAMSARGPNFLYDGLGVGGLIGLLGLALLVASRFVREDKRG